MQQHLPFTVLKPIDFNRLCHWSVQTVATAPTVYGIETTVPCNDTVLISLKLQQHLPFTVLKLEEGQAIIHNSLYKLQQHLPFTVLKRLLKEENNMNRQRLQQHLPFTVLKLANVDIHEDECCTLQQHLPFTVLKLFKEVAS